MPTRNIDSKLAPAQLLSRRPTNSSGRSRNPNAVVPSTDAPTSSHSANTIVSRNELGQKARIVVVRTLSQTDAEGEEVPDANEIKEAENSNSIRLPAALTDGVRRLIMSIFFNVLK